MKNGHRRPRNNHSGREGLNTAFGARYPIAYDSVVASFFTKLGTQWRQTTAGAAFLGNHFDDNPPDRFTLHNDSRRIGMTVLEKRITTKHGRRYHVRWNKDDIGRIRGEIDRELTNLRRDYDDIDLTAVELTDVIRVGDAESMAHGRELAVVANQTSPMSEFLVRSHELVVAGLSANLAQFHYPHEEYVPKWTIGRIFRDVSPSQIDRSVEALQDQILPVIAHIEPIRFFTEQETV